MNRNKISISASWIMIGRAVQLLLTFLCTMYVSRYLGPNDYGRMTYVYSYIQLFLPLCTLGMNDIIVKELVDDPENNDKILGTTIGLRLFSSLISMILSVLLVMALNENDGIYRTIAILQSFALLFQSFDTIAYFYQSKLLSKTVGIVYVFAYGASSIFRMIGILMKRTVSWFAFSMSFDYLMIAVLFVIAYLHGGNRFRFSFSTAKKLLSKSVYYIFAGLLIVIYGKVTEILFLGKMVSDADVGYYAAATTLCNAWPFILTAIIDSMAPVIIETYQKDLYRFEKKMRQLYAIVFYISVIAAIGIDLIAKQAIDIAYGIRYLPAVTPMRIYAWSTAFSYIGVARAIWMQCEKKINLEVTISLFGAVANILLNYILIRSYGTTGAAIAAVVTQLFTNFVLLFVMKGTRRNAKLILEGILLRDVFEKREGR